MTPPSLCLSRLRQHSQSETACSYKKESEDRGKKYSHILLPLLYLLIGFNSLNLTLQAPESNLWGVIEVIYYTISH